MSIRDAFKALVAPDPLTRLDLPRPAVKDSALWWPDRGSSYSYVSADTRLRSTRSHISYEEVDAMFSSAFIACLSTVTRALPQAPLEVLRRLEDGTEEPLPTHPLLDLFAHPNPYHTTTQLHMALLTNYFVSGDGYLQIARDGFSAARQLYSRPYWAITPRGTETELIDHYDYKVNNKLTVIKRDDMLHFRNGIDERPPSNSRCGVSPIESVMGELYTDDEAASLVSTIMSNGGVFTLYTPKAPVSVSDPDADAWEARLAAKTTGGRRGAYILAQVEMDAKTIGIKPDELDYKEIRHLVEERVAAVMCVPAMRAGLGAGLERSTFANFEESGAALWEDCLVPLLRDFDDVLTTFLLPQFGDSNGLRVAHAFDKVPALQEGMDAKVKRAVELYDGGIITRNEARAEAGRESEGPTGDVYKLKVGEQLVPWKTPPETLQPAQQQVDALNQMAGQQPVKAYLAGYVAAKSEDAPTADDWPDAIKILTELGGDELVKRLVREKE